MAGKFFPGEAAVRRFVDAAAWATAFASPGVNLQRPHAGKQNARVAGVHHDLGGAGVLVDKQHALPGLAAVRRAKDAPLRLWSIAVAHGGGEHNVRVLRIDNDAADATSLLKPHQLPGLARVSGFVDARADRDMAANVRLAGTRPNCVWIGRRDGQRTDRGHGVLIENCIPMNAAVRCRSEERTSELQSHSDLHSFPTRRSSDLPPKLCLDRKARWPENRSRTRGSDRKLHPNECRRPL